MTLNVARLSGEDVQYRALGGFKPRLLHFRHVTYGLSYHHSLIFFFSLPTNLHCKYDTLIPCCEEKAIKRLDCHSVVRPVVNINQ